MKLGISYMAFDGIELLEFAIKSIRKEVDFVSVTYQDISYFGNPSDSNSLIILENLKSKNLIDEILHFETNLNLPPKDNELSLRNLGLSASRKNGCTHHISADVDEFYMPEQLAYAKKEMEKENYDFSVAYMEYYYKDPTFLVSPSQNLLVTFIHPISNEYNKDVVYPEFPFPIEITRRFSNYKKHRIFTKEEFMIHHMSYVRKNITKKFANSDNAQFYELDKFMKTFNNYEVGDRVCLLPEFMNRKTIKVENIFGIEI